MVLLGISVRRLAPNRLWAVAELGTGRLLSVDPLPLTSPSGDVEKAVTELIIGFDTSTEEEGPYEALYNAVSCHSLDSTASGRSSDRDSGNKEAEAAGVKAAGVRPVRGRGLRSLALSSPGLAGVLGAERAVPSCQLARRPPGLCCGSISLSVLKP